MTSFRSHPGKVSSIIILFSVWTVLFFGGTVSADIRFGVTPYLSEAELKNAFTPLMTAMGNRIGQKVTLVIARDYTDLADKMAVGSVDFAAFSPFAYVDAAKKTKMTVFASHCVGGRSSYQGVIIALSRKGYRSIDALAEKTFAFVDPKSASGFLYPRALLIRDGKNPDLFFGKTIFSGSHDKVIQDLIRGKADAGAVYSDALESAESRYGYGMFRVLTKTDPIPYDAYVARNGLDPAIVNAVKRFFLSLMPDTPPLKQIIDQGAGLKFTGWVSADDSRYDVVRETAAMSRTQKKIAVLGFSADGRSIKKGKLNDAFSEIISAYLGETNRYVIVPRYHLENVLLRHGFTLSSAPTPEYLHLLKQELDIDLLLSGKLSGEGKALKADCILSGTGAEQDRHDISLNCRAVEELNTMALECVSWVQKTVPVEAYVMAVEGKELTIFGGSDRGFSPNGRFVVINLGEKEHSPDGNRVTGRKRRQVAEGVFHSVEKETAFGSITAGSINRVDVGSRIMVIESSTSKETEIYDAYLKGVKALSEDRNKDAARYFSGVVEKDPDDAIAHARLSTALYNLGDSEKGKFHLESAAKHIDTVTFQERSYILARLSTESGETEKARALYLDILKKYPDNTSALHNLGMLYLQTGTANDKKQAADCFDKALAIDPDLTISRNALAGIRGARKNTPVQKADIVVIFDTTGSMGEELRGMIENTEKFVDYLKKHRIQAALGLISFGDAVEHIYFDDPKKPVLTTDSALFVNHLRKFKPDGGGDPPENPYQAMETAMNYKFRKDSRKIFLLITDARAHISDTTYPKDTAHIIDELNSKNISTVIIGPPNRDYQILAEGTGGVLINIHSTPDFSQKILKIGESIVHLF